MARSPKIADGPEVRLRGPQSIGAEGYDAVVDFFSFHAKEAQPVVDNLAATIRAGKPALIIHGTARPTWQSLL
jgi:hypothetical protein